MCVWLEKFGLVAVVGTVSCHGCGIGGQAPSIKQLQKHVEACQEKLGIVSEGGRGGGAGRSGNLEDGPRAPGG